RSLVLCESVPIFFPWTAACLGYVYALTRHIDDGLRLIEQAVADDRVQRGGARLASAAGTLHSCLLASAKAVCWQVEWTRLFIGPARRWRSPASSRCEAPRPARSGSWERSRHIAPPRRLRPQNSITARARDRGRARHAPPRRPLPSR